MKWVIADMGLYSTADKRNQGNWDTTHCVVDPDPGNFSASLSPMSPNTLMHGFDHVARCLPSLTSEQSRMV